MQGGERSGGHIDNDTDRRPGAPSDVPNPRDAAPATVPRTPPPRDCQTRFDLGRGAWALARRHPAFGLLWAARTVSFAGDSLTHIALILYVSGGRGGGPAVAGLLLVTDFAPMLLAPVLGVFGDRMDRRRLMLMTALLQSVVVLVIAALMPGLVVLLILVGINANLGRAFAPASASVVPQLVADADLGVANSALGFGTYGLAIFGPVGAAVLLPAIGLRGVLIVDAGTFATSLLLLLRLRVPSTLPMPSPWSIRLLWADARAGLRCVWSNRIVRVVVIGFGLLVACTALDDVALVFLAKRTLHATSSQASILYAGADVGLLLGFLALTGIRRIPPWVLFVLGLAVSSLGNMLTGLSWLLGLAIGSQIVRGLGIAGQDTGSNTLLQRHVPAEMHSRVFANFYNVIGLAAGVSYLAGGLALVPASPRAVLALAGIGGLVVACGTGITLRRTIRRASGK